MSKASDRGAVLQFEFDRRRIVAMSSKTTRYKEETVNIHAHDVIRGALQDVFDNGGTLVVVVSDKKITVVQRPDAADIGDDLPEQKEKQVSVRGATS